MEQRLTIKNLTILSLISSIIIAIFSTGFQHYDEHFQIIEFLNFKLTGMYEADLTWEYKYQMRPWFQVFIYYCFAKPLQLVGITSPFFLVFLFRLFNSLLGFYTLIRLRPLIYRWFEKKDHLLAIFLLHFCWFTPYILTRSSSESLAISLLFIGFSTYLTSGQKALPAIIAGLLFGLSYQARFQVAAMVAPIWFWSIIIGRFRPIVFISCAAGVLLGIGSGFLFDLWGYGEWNFSLWEYFRGNYLTGHMSKLKHYPSWWYFRWMFNRGIPPVSLPLIIAGLIFIVKKWKHPITWAIIPFTIIHSINGHKEIRFLFPVIMLSPLMLAWVYSNYRELFDRSRTLRFLRGAFLVVNMLFFVIVLFRPANPAPNFYKFIHNSDIEKVCSPRGAGNPYIMLGKTLHFYKKKGYEFRKVENISQCQAHEYIFYSKGRHFFDAMEDPKQELVYLTYPQWLLNFNVGNWMSRSRCWAIFKRRL